MKYNVQHIHHSASKFNHFIYPSMLPSNHPSIFYPIIHLWTHLSKKVNRVIAGKPNMSPVVALHIAAVIGIK